MEINATHERREIIRKSLVEKIKGGNHREVREFLLFHGGSINELITMVYSYFD